MGAVIAQVIPVGSIDGTILDATSALVPGAEVKAAEIATGQTRTTTSDGQGRYFLPQLRPGRYRIAVEKSGFQMGATCTWSKSIEKLRYIDQTDPGPSKMIGEFDRPHRATLHFIWNLTFGRGQRFGISSPVANRLFGGSRVNGVYTFQSGQAIPPGDMLATG